MPVCQRCGIDKKLVAAHIVPKVFWGLPPQEAGSLAIVSDSDGWRTKRSPAGIYDENILCSSCDEFIGTFDQHGAENLLRGGSQRRQIGPDLVCREYSTAQANQIIRFMCSVLWRAAISKNSFYSRIDLGPYLSMVRNAFENQNCNGSLEFIIEEFDKDSIPQMDPFMSRIETRRVATVFANRFLFHIKLDQQTFSSEMKKIAIQNGRPVITTIKNWETSKHRLVMYDLVKDLERPKFWKRPNA